MRDGRAVTIVREGPVAIPDLESLWLSLHEHHVAVAPRLGGLEARPSAEAWAQRRASYETWLRQPGAFLLVARRRGEAIGYALVHMMCGLQGWRSGDRIAHLQTLSVLPEHRDEGVGTELLQAVRDHLTGSDIRELTLGVISGNVDALRFYERHGFEPAWTVMLAPVEAPAHPPDAPGEASRGRGSAAWARDDPRG